MAEIVVRKRDLEKTGQVERLPNRSPFDKGYGYWGRVDKVNSGDHSADIFLDSGIYLKRIPVSCREWVVPGDEYTSGERNLPPINARVFVFMPNGTFDGCFVLCSGLIVTEKPQKEAFMPDDKEKFRKHVTPGNWKIDYDYTTGSYKAVSPDEKTSINIDYGEGDEKKDPPELHLKLFDNIKADVVSDDNVTVSVFDELTIGHLKGDSIIAEAFEEISLEHKKGDSCTINVFDTEIIIKNGEVKVNTTKETITTKDIDIKSTAPVGINGGGSNLNSASLTPYWNAETVAHTALSKAANSALGPATILDVLSGGTGLITAFFTAVIAYCAAQIKAESAAIASSKPIIK